MAKNYVGFRKALAQALDDALFDDSINTDLQTCPRCGGSMPFHGGTIAIGEGYWECVNCGFRVVENELNQYYSDYINSF